MGYALDVRAARSLDDVATALTDATLRLDDLDPRTFDRLPERVRANWDLLATTIADAIADGGGTPDGTLIQYVLAVLAHHSHSWLPLDYSSASGAWFRDELIGTHVAGLVGDDTAAHLLRRSLAGLTPSELPAWGHLTASEVAELVAGDLAVPDDHPEHDTLRDLAAVLDRAARMECALLTIHA